MPEATTISSEEFDLMTSEGTEVDEDSEEDKNAYAPATQQNTEDSGFEPASSDDQALYEAMYHQTPEETTFQTVTSTEGTEEETASKLNEHRIYENVLGLIQQAKKGENEKGAQLEAKYREELEDVLYFTPTTAFNRRGSPGLLPVDDKRPLSLLSKSKFFIFYLGLVDCSDTPVFQKPRIR